MDRNYFHGIDSRAAIDAALRYLRDVTRHANKGTRLAGDPYITRVNFEEIESEDDGDPTWRWTIGDDEWEAVIHQSGSEDLSMAGGDGSGFELRFDRTFKLVNLAVKGKKLFG